MIQIGHWYVVGLMRRVVDVLHLTVNIVYELSLGTSHAVANLSWSGTLLPSPAVYHYDKHRDNDHHAEQYSRDDENLIFIDAELRGLDRRKARLLTQHATCTQSAVTDKATKCVLAFAIVFARVLRKTTLIDIHATVMTCR